MRLFWKALLYVTGGVAIVGLIGGIAAGAYVYSLLERLPDYKALQEYEPPITTRVFAGDGSLVAEFARERRMFVPYEDVPPRVIHAFISAEDKNFYTHPGIDLMGIARAAVENVSNYLNDRRLEGASTITQQVAKNFLLTSEVSLERKLMEALLSFRIEDAYSKPKILELYLNEIYLGAGSYGVAAAALNYFDKALAELTVGEAAYLAALPKAPSTYHPVFQKARALERRNWVIGQMLENGFITRAQADAAIAEDLVVRLRPMGAQTAEGEFFAEEVRRIIMQRYGERSLYDGGLVVRSTIDPRLQRIGIRALRDGLQRYDRRHGWRGPVERIDLGEGWQRRLAAVPALQDVPEWQLAVVTRIRDPQTVLIGFADGRKGVIPFDDFKWARPSIDQVRVGPEPRGAGDVLAEGDVIYVQAVPGGGDTYSLRQVPAVNGGLVALDPHTGRVLAAVGGFSYRKSEFNRVTQALRQTGSSFKPIVYAAALDSGYTPSSAVLDGPFVIEQGPGLPLWRPENYSQDYLGETTLRIGLAKSRNLMTVRMAHAVGMQKIVDYAKNMGAVRDMMPMLAMSLGAQDTTVLNLASAYAVFVNGGKRVVPTFIDRVQDRHGRTIYRHDQRDCPGCNSTGWHRQEEPLLAVPGTDVLNPQTAYQIVSMLEGVVLYGTGQSVREVGVPLAGKTGTTNEEKDAWFIGFSPDLVVGVYIGFDQPKPMGRGETGGGLAAPVFRDFMKAAIGDKPAVPFRVPPGLEFVRVNRRTGQPTFAGDPLAIMEAFKAGTGPETGIDLVEGEYAARYDEEGNAVADPTLPPSVVSGGTGGLY